MFEYKIVYDGLEMLLNELNIDITDVVLTVDEDEGTYKASMDYSFKLVQQGQSDKLVQLRLSDWLCGFIGRMLFALKNDESNRERVLYDINSIDCEDIKRKRLLSAKWFDINVQHFEMYLLLYNTLIVQHEHQWTVLSMTYSDDVVCLYSLLRYFASYYSFESFKRVPLSQHAEYYNDQTIRELERYYQNNTWR